MELQDLFFEEHPNPMLIYEYESLQILRVNKSAIKKYGYSRKEFLGMTIEEIRPEEDIPLLHEALDEISSPSKTFDRDTFRHQTKAGEILYVQITAQFYEYDGQDARIVHIHDLTETVKLKNSYKETLDEIHLHIEGNPLAMVKYDANLCVTEWSKRAEEKLGYMRNEVIGTKLFELDITPPTEKAKVRKYLAKIEENNTDEVRFDTIAKRKSGEQVHVRIHASAIREEQGNFKSVLVFIEDIDEQKRLEDLLQNTQKMAKIGGWEYYPETDDLYYTDEMYRIKEMEVGAEINIKKALQFYPPEEKKKIEESLHHAVEEEEKYDVTIQFNTAGGKQKWGRAMGRPVLHNGKMFKITGTLQDITEQKLKEQEIMKNADEKEVLLAEIHHRVKNNLAIISGLLELKAMNVKNGELTDILQQSQLRIHSMAMIHEALYKAENFTNLEFTTFARNLLVAIQQAHNGDEQKITIGLECENSLDLNVNQAIPAGLMMNELITNSFKHAFKEVEEGRINVFINYAKEENQVILKVEDNGVGLPEKYIEQETNSLGSRLLKQLTKQLSGELTLRNGDGAVAELRFKRDTEKSGSSSGNFKQN